MAPEVTATSCRVVVAAVVVVSSPRSTNAHRAMPAPKRHTATTATAHGHRRRGGGVPGASSWSSRLEGSAPVGAVAGDATAVCSRVMASSSGAGQGDGTESAVSSLRALHPPELGTLHVDNRREAFSVQGDPILKVGWPIRRRGERCVLRPVPDGVWDPSSGGCSSRPSLRRGSTRARVRSAEATNQACCPRCRRRPRTAPEAVSIATFFGLNRPDDDARLTDRPSATRQSSALEKELELDGPVVLDRDDLHARRDLHAVVGEGHVD